ncbi:MAG: tRNA (adenosine(37)-N6)-dimethylallyltransferase MiaA [Hyphomicrobiaceae bacterium]
MKPILIAGPTASGKSALAVALARHYGGVVVNADSMQVYAVLDVLTARPSAEDLARAPHRLYGHVHPAQPYSVMTWLADVAGVLEEAAAEGLRPIIVGGTGLYFKALTEGLSPVPEIPADIRTRWRQAAGALGAAALHQELSRRDPVMAARLATGDTQRVTRALEVIAATGRSLAEWQQMRGTPLLPASDAICFSLAPPRADVQARCDLRFDLMIEQGALEEVRRLLALGLPVDRPVMRALGVPSLARHLCGEADLATAIASGKQETRAYVKRQQTWANRYMMSWSVVQSIYNCKILPRFTTLVDDAVN